jgi:AcrR family transcriptional regulator
MSTDPRVVRTRKAIVDAVHTLSREGATSIGVADITRTAGISRATLYSHFSSLDRIALYVFEGAVESITALAFEAGDDPSPERMRQFLTLLVDHYDENRPLYSAVLALPVSLEVNSRAVERLGSIFVAQLFDSTLPPGLHPEVIARYTSSATIGVLDAWIHQDLLMTADETVDHLIQLMPPSLSGAANKHATL